MRHLLAMAAVALGANHAMAQRGTDHCRDAAVIGVGPHSDYIVGATSDAVRTCDWTPRDIWYRLVAPADGVWNVQATGASLSLYGACDGDVQPTCAERYWESGPSARDWVRAPASAGQTLWLRVGNEFSTTIMFTTDFGPPAPPNDEPAGAVALSDGAFAGTTVNAMRSAPSQGGRGEDSADVWYVFDAPVEGALVVRACVDSGPAPTIQLYTSPTADGFARCGMSEGLCGGGAIAMNAGDRIWVRVASTRDNERPFTLYSRFDAAPRPINDRPDQALEVRFGDVIEGTTVGAGSFNTYPCYAPSAGPSVWYVIRPPLDSHHYLIRLCGRAGYEPRVVYGAWDFSGDVCGDGQEILVAGEKRIAVGAVGGASGDFEMSVDVLVSTCDPDFNLDGSANADDIVYAINVVGGGDNPTGVDPDFNHDGNVDQDDFAALIDVIAGGFCP